MTSKQRVLKALDRKEPDKVPIGEWGIDHDTAEKVLGRPTYWRNRKAETLAFWEGRRDEVVQSWKEDLVELIEKLDQDLVPVMMVPPKGMLPTPMRRIDEGTWEDSSGQLYRHTAANDAILCIESNPPRAFRSPDEVRDHFEQSVVPAAGFSIRARTDKGYQLDLVDDSRLELVRFVVKRLGRERFLFARDFSEWEGPFGGHDADFYMSTATNPELVKLHFDLVTELHLARARVYLDEGVDAIMPGGDFSDSNGPLVSPATIRSLFLPGMRRLSDFVHDRGARMMSHNCGNNWKILDILVDAGYEGIQSIQSKTATMDLKLMKERHGAEMAFWGGINIETLHDGTPSDNREDVRYALRHAAPGGGFILGTSNSVSYGSNYENYMAALETCHRFGDYPLRFS